MSVLQIVGLWLSLARSLENRSREFWIKFRVMKLFETIGLQFDLHGHIRSSALLSAGKCDC